MGNQWTTNGLNLVATAVQSASADAAITYVGISAGCGTLATAITSGVAITSLTLSSGLPIALSSGQSLTVTDGTNAEAVTVASGGAAQSATSIPITSWTPTYSYAATTSGVAPTPATSDTALYNESARVAVSAAAAGANAGESLISAYFDGTQATSLYLAVGFFGGATATSATGTGTLMANGIQTWQHTQNSDTQMYQGDGII